jgi:hypothetical protein
MREEASEKTGARNRIEGEQEIDNPIISLKIVEVYIGIRVS